MTFDDITFFPVRPRRIRCGQPRRAAAEVLWRRCDRDLGLGRQQLLLKWLLEGEYVSVPGYEVRGQITGPGAVDASHHDQDSGARRLRVGNAAEIQSRQVAGLHPIAGSSATGTSLHDIYIAQVHDTGKAGIRAALARMIADPPTNTMVLTITRAEFASNGCRNIKPATLAERVEPQGPARRSRNTWRRRRRGACSSRRRSSTPVPRLQHHPLVLPREGERQADPQGRARSRSISSPPASIFIDKVITDSKAIYDATLGSESGSGAATEQPPDGADENGRRAERHQPAHRPRASTTTDSSARRPSGDDVPGSEGVGTATTSRRLDLGGGEQKFAESDADIVTIPPDGITPADRNLNDLDRLDVSLHKPTFVLGSGELGNPKINQECRPRPASATSRSRSTWPEKKVKEANRLNNLNGFWYYILDRSSDEVLSPTVPSSVAAARSRSEERAAEARSRVRPDGRSAGHANLRLRRHARRPDRAGHARARRVHRGPGHRP